MTTINRIYHNELKVARVVARFIDEHPTLTKIFLWLMGIAIMTEVFLFV